MASSRYLAAISLSIFETINVATHYKYKGEIIDYLPYDYSPESIAPIYHSLKGWNTDLTQITNEGEFPLELKNYIVDFLLLMHYDAQINLLNHLVHLVIGYE